MPIPVLTSGSASARSVFRPSTPRRQRRFRSERLARKRMNIALMSLNTIEDGADVSWLLSTFCVCAAVPLLQYISKQGKDSSTKEGKSSVKKIGRNKLAATDWGGHDSEGPRDEMEDSWCMRNLNGKLLYFGIFDGHGGAASSTYLKSNLLDFIDEAGIKMCDQIVKDDALKDYGVDEQNPLASAFERADSALLDHLGSLGDPECWSGSTATVCFVSENYIITANVGDSRAVLGRNGRTVDMSNDHRPVGSSKAGRAEISRIIESGGWVSQMRVCGILAVSRAFGDYEFKGGRVELLQEFKSTGASGIGTLERPPVVALPDVRVYERSEEDDFLVIATDGLWDVMNSAQAITFVRSMMKRDSTCKMHDVASALVERAIKSRTQDNVSCIVVDLRSGQL